MHWYYEFNGQPEGPIAEAELRQLLSDRKIDQHTRVWQVGMEDWAPVHSIQGIEPPRQSAPPAAFAERDDPADLPPGVGDNPCESETPSLSWEQKGSAGGGPLAFLQTVFAVLFLPGKTFARMNHAGSWGPPLLFYLLGSLVGWLSFFETAFLLAQNDPNIPPQLLENFKQLPEQTLLTLIKPSLVMSGMFGPIALLAATLCLHGALLVCGAATRPFATTYRLAAYLLGSLGIAFSLLPATVQIAVISEHPESSGLWASNFLLILALWSFSCVVRGAASAHGAQVIRVFFGVLLLLLTTIVPPFALLVRVAEMAAIKP